MARKSKRVVVINDLHCGHLTGLTPPLWQHKKKKAVTMITDDEGGKVTVDNTKHNKWAALQRETWREYEKIITALQPIDILVVNGDCIDGKGKRSGGTELITTDRNIQVEMASFCIKTARAKKVVIIYGTPYHVGMDEDWENNVADKVGAKTGSHEWLDVNGLIFDVKHKIGSSSIPHGRFTAIAKDRFWNVMWAEREMQPKAHVFLRGHVHYHGNCGGPDWLAITLPALQAMGSKFGARQCSGCVDWGLVFFDVTSKDDYTWQPVLRNIRCQKTEAIKL